MSAGDSTSPLSVAVVGAGFVGQEHVTAAQRAAQSLGLRFVPDDALVVDIDSQRAECVAQAAGWRAGTINDLRDQSPSLVVVATPPAAHAEVVLALADTGCRFLVEKPLAPTRRDALLMAPLSSRIAVGLSQRYLPAIAYLRQSIQVGVLGAVTSVTAQYEVCQLPGEVGSNWRLNREHGLGVLGDIGCHAIDMIEFILGDSIRPRGASVLYSSALDPGTSSNDDAAICTFTMARGGIGGLNLSRVSRGRSKPKQSLRIVGESATLEWRRSNLDIVRVEHASEVTNVDVTYGDRWVVQGQRATPWSEQFFLQMSDALQWSCRDIQSETLATFDEGLQTLETALEFAALGSNNA